ncbi:MAG: UDP-N-acetylmuramoyl-tripeptide--D-alanyl-D-alanine ligase [Sedimentisphaerales bacterium]|jgi:UDP-N-acetylmuramoyl-tripeptide--D-alanyl-D-alanine ligase|nr:UDP-N-acetylmuramoyl-tripeptide--D-alanyl-D-alanine ligase [Sedimentisphaerales bacterium]HNY78264.1 UDP-N-acetylmuramoyl-tripeptide--D-alanyl-D-alanine ligase [Sedimentisphaerales bacterium]HOC61811.1 UDP-N-acetylmuramoyl-tripeptide--D-alanyl-D-alanine ligase [Sedimentisphaerales bacterium]HOH64335.1 UDP-N-acetylmuramoyl-tripeptide--D-alanyl-D-alanine ligase [Sedimentisphaerales bacterium]HPY49193.1 UDP-N-acetylmuramoyl-tripeptide--D-alanyl-D-alanine ligase [Sedimentisphaerales bacterium]
MKQLSIEIVGRILNAPIAPGDSGRLSIVGISTDSRTTKAGDCFFALPGERFDGHDHVADAFARGAACAVVSRDVDAPGPLLKVADTIVALGDLAREYRRMHAFKVVAITGSVGKTTTRQIVHHVLSRHFRTHQAQKNFNNTIGLPLTLLDARPDDEVIVAELGANQLGEIAYLTRIAQPNVAVVTNVHPAHLAGFGSLDTIVREKTAIARGLADDGVFIVNGDMEILTAACRSLGRPFRTFGRSPDADYRANRIAHHGLTSSFVIEEVPVELPLPGPGNVENALAAWAVCSQFGLTVEEFARAVRTLSGVAMRVEPLQLGTLTVLNDCYNASPASMKNALAILAGLRAEAGAKRRTVFVCGHMAELGAQSEALHAELGREVARAGVDLLVAVGGPTRATAEAAREAATYDLRAVCFDDTASLCDNLERIITEYDIILVKGSRAARLETVVQGLIKGYQR